jgi:Icc-related predicted phosphoesterase
MRIVFISDTHDLQDAVNLPEGDILIHAGDLTMLGRMNEIAAAGHWLREAGKKFKEVVVVAGNHDWMFQRNRMMALNLLNNGITNEGRGRIKYLEDSGCTVLSLKIWGSPWQPTFFDWAFNLDRGEAIRRKWDMIPEGLDILITHGPPMGIHDQISPHLGSEHLGDEELMAAVERAKPKIHVFGHIHGGYGQTQYVNTLFVNAAICNEAYKPVNQPIVIELPDVEAKEEAEEA